jgi:hypothetical protein
MGLESGGANGMKRHSLIAILAVVIVLAGSYGSADSQSSPGELTVHDRLSEASAFIDFLAPTGASVRFFAPTGVYPSIRLVHNKCRKHFTILTSFNNWN